MLPCDLEAATIQRLVERVLAPLGLRIDRSAPIVDARLADGTRIHVAIPPVAVDGPYLTIRRPAARALGLPAFGLAPEPLAFVRWMVAAGWNLLVSGGTSTGKTTFLAALAAEVDPAERIVTIEETAELRVDRPHVVRLEARPANAEGAGEVDVRTLVRSSLRMRPDRIVLGEVRAGEALDIVQALSRGTTARSAPSTPTTRRVPWPGSRRWRWWARRRCRASRCGSCSPGRSTPSSTSAAPTTAAAR